MANNSQLVLLEKLRDGVISDLEKRLKIMRSIDLEEVNSSCNNEDDFQALLDLYKKKEVRKIFRNLDKKEYCIVLEQFKRSGVSYTLVKPDEKYLYGKLNLEIPKEFDLVKSDDIVDHVLLRFKYTWVFVKKFLPSLGLERENIRTIILNTDNKSRDAVESDKPEGDSGTKLYPGSHMNSAKMNPEFLQTDGDHEKDMKKIIYEILYDVLKIVEFMPEMVNTGIDFNMDTATNQLIVSERLAFAPYRTHIQENSKEGKAILDKVKKLKASLYEKLQLGPIGTENVLQSMESTELDKVFEIKSLKLQQKSLAELKSERVKEKQKLAQTKQPKAVMEKKFKLIESNLKILQKRENKAEIESFCNQHKKYLPQLKSKLKKNTSGETKETKIETLNKKLDSILIESKIKILQFTEKYQRNAEIESFCKQQQEDLTLLKAEFKKEKLDQIEKFEKNIKGIEEDINLLESVWKILQLEEYKLAIKCIFKISSDERTCSEEIYNCEFAEIEKKFQHVFYTCYYDAYIKKLSQKSQGHRKVALRDKKILVIKHYCERRKAKIGIVT